MSINVLCITSHSDIPETEMFIGLHRSGFHMEIMCPPEAPHRKRLIDAGVPVTNLSLKGRFDPTGISEIRSFIEKNHIDILHLFNNKAASNGIIASRGLPVKIICYRGTVGNVSFFDPASWTTYLHPRVDKIICVSEAIRKYFLNMRLLSLRIKPEKVVTVYKGHDISWYNEKPADLKKEFSIPESAFVVCCAANYRPGKGIEFLVEATKLFPADTNLHILLVGNMNSSALIKKINQSPLKNNFHLTGFRRDAPALMAASDVSVLLSIKKEGLSKVVIESMIYGVVPIVTAIGGNTELVVDGESGIVIPPKNARALHAALISLMKNPMLRKTLGDNAKKRIIDHFKNQTTVDQTLAIYNDLMSG
ncbi:glycosyltransferase family 4 protein [Pelovirga terrestris]|uniref:Glycosyltransferase family 4 protein n=1 Tax=Pelovirga terrestris TaxID=2771352 RepID=A0A8J6QSP8_9BACT|nr:glycosyltransferase family 4 protein [Pelovirga terrestris]MBD1401020.1 glycosyltransferase family 4 protein [Pelovirga terrestris]